MKDERYCIDCIYATEAGFCCYYYRQTLIDELPCKHFISRKEIT